MLTNSLVYCSNRKLSVATKTGNGFYSLLIMVVSSSNAVCDVSSIHQCIPAASYWCKASGYATVYVGIAFCR